MARMPTDQEVLGKMEMMYSRLVESEAKDQIRMQEIETLKKELEEAGAEAELK